MSIKIEEDKIIRSEQVSYEDPSRPFSEFKHPELDGVWKNYHNGNSISYISDCNPQNDSSFSSIKAGIVSGIQNRNIKKEHFIEFNNRKAMSSHFTGQVDGVDTEFKIIILKKNSCVYVITYVAVQKTFRQDIKKFDSFVEGFKAE